MSGAMASYATGSRRAPNGSMEIKLDHRTYKWTPYERANVMILSNAIPLCMKFKINKLSCESAVSAPNSTA